MGHRCRERRARLVVIRNVVTLGLVAVLAGGCLVGVGDPYFPTYGNGGYDVAHYDLAIRYDPATDVLQGTASIDARATSALSIFDLDLMGLTVHGITVDGRPARWVHGRHELTVTPARPLRARHRFRVVVAYSGVPVPTANGGFIATGDGAAVSGEPEGAATWFPVNDHPIDKATYTFRVTVPDGLGVIANGLPVGAPRRATPGWTTHVWQTFTPMASYLATVDIGHWNVQQRRTTTGLPIIDAVDPKWAGPLVDGSLAQEPEMIDFLSSQFGRYPVESAGDRRRPPTALRARDPDPSDLPGLLLLAPRPGPHRPPRARPPVVRGQRLARSLAGHLAERGFRNLRGVALERARASRVTAGNLPRELPGDPARRPVLEARDRRSGTGAPVLRRRVRPRGDDAPGTPRLGRRRGVLRHPSRVGRATSATATARRPSSPCSRRGSRAARSHRCFTGGCTPRPSHRCRRRRAAPRPQGHPRPPRRPTRCSTPTPGAKISASDSRHICAEQDGESTSPGSIDRVQTT